MTGLELEMFHAIALLIGGLGTYITMLAKNKLENKRGTPRRRTDNGERCHTIPLSKKDLDELAARIGRRIGELEDKVNEIDKKQAILIDRGKRE